ncbi:hypothetical protein KJ836_03690 [Patescibacteria group bacterium]|nr:hypothetical protein [Patescibacteria group bacterium]
MAKKLKKTAKEIERLSGLYKSDNQSIGVSPIETIDNASGILATAHAKKHAIIRHDLISLLIIAFIMLVALFALNYFVDNTSLGATLTNIIGKLI